MHVAESVPSATGAVASARLICEAPRLAVLAQALGSELGVAATPADALSESERRWMEAAANDLRAHRGRSLLAIGAPLNRLPRLSYPVFAASRFRLASKDRFFL